MYESTTNKNRAVNGFLRVKYIFRDRANHFQNLYANFLK